MIAQEYDKLYPIEEYYWWFTVFRRIYRYLMDRALQRNRIRSPFVLLDLGCGTGRNMLEFADLTPWIIGVDHSLDALRHAQTRGLTHLVQADANHLPFKPDALDAVFSADLLVYIDNMGSFLTQLNRCIKPNGFFLFTAAAFQWLYSRHDRAVGSIRRFTRPELIQQLTDAGFSIHFMTYCNTILFFPIAIIRLLTKKNRVINSDYSLLPKPLNLILTFIFRIELNLIKTGIKLPFGISILGWVTPQSV
ncbi:MAG: class I SAM-dependent methyltransferase [Candidatus Delongbacteria bacterium]|nr:class I SAM-dependent methyltransferase [Candidatus Delongbacteria bacterium]